MWSAHFQWELNFKHNGSTSVVLAARELLFRLKERTCRLVRFTTQYVGGYSKWTVRDHEDHTARMNGFWESPNEHGAQVLRLPLCGIPGLAAHCAVPVSLLAQRGARLSRNMELAQGRGGPSSLVGLSPYQVRRSFQDDFQDAVRRLDGLLQPPVRASYPPAYGTA